MALFDLSRPSDQEEIIGSDAATRALSVTAVETDFVARVYEKLSSVYDFTFGPTLHPGRLQAIERMNIQRMTVFDLSMSWVYAGVGFGCFLMLIRQVQNVWRNARAGWSKPDDITHQIAAD